MELYTIRETKMTYKAAKKYLAATDRNYTKFMNKSEGVDPLIIAEKIVQETFYKYVNSARYDLIEILNSYSFEKLVAFNHKELNHLNHAFKILFPEYMSYIQYGEHFYPAKQKYSRLFAYPNTHHSPNLMLRILTIFREYTDHIKILFKDVEQFKKYQNDLYDFILHCNKNITIDDESRKF